METVSRFLTPPTASFFLFGPRGTGKSTWIKQRFPKSLYLDLLDPETLRLHQARPERLREFVAASESPQTFVVDEVQKAPELLTVVHSLIEEKRGHRFILTGSSARKLKRTGSDLLAGRASLQTLHPFMAAELEGLFDLGLALKRGLLPLVWGAANPNDTLRTYAALYLREEVQQEGLVRNIGNFSRFLESMAFSHASLLNISNVARDCAVERKTVEGYLAILEDLLLSFTIPVFTKRAKRGLVGHPKFYFFDAGVFRSLRPSGPLDRPEEAEGLALEGLVAQHLRAWASYGGGKQTLSFWRTHSGTEVDFVVYGPDGFWGIEVKHASKILDKDLKSLRSFLEDYPEAKALFLYQGKERLKKGKILCLPAGDFLIQLKPGRRLDAEI